MLLFLDNDVIIKLAASNLFWDAATCLGFQSHDLRVLATAEFVFKSKAMEKIYPKSIRDSAISIVKQCQTANLIYDKNLEILMGIEGIDPGEATLIVAATIQDSLFYLATGDKRCLMALSASTGLASIRQQLNGRIICLEQIIKKLIETRGFQYVLSQVILAREYDKSLKAIFGSGKDSTPDNVAIALEGYIQDLRKNAPGLLAEV